MNDFGWKRPGEDGEPSDAERQEPENPVSEPDAQQDAENLTAPLAGGTEQEADDTKGAPQTAPMEESGSDRAAQHQNAGIPAAGEQNDTTDSAQTIPEEGNGVQKREAGNSPAQPPAGVQGDSGKEPQPWGTANGPQGAQYPYENPSYPPYPPQGNGFYPPPYPPQGNGFYPPPYPPQGNGSYPPPYSQQPFGYRPPRTYAPFGQDGGRMPYHQPDFTPKPPKSRGYRLFIGALATLAAVFVLGFFSMGVLTALSPERAGSSSEQPSEAPPESGADIQGSDNAQAAPSGTLVSPGYAGLAIASVPSGGERTAKDIYIQVSSSIVGVLSETEQGSSTGSGIICSADGYIITNSHVISDTKNPARLQVVLHDSQQYNAVVVGFDKTTDLAVLKINAKNLPAAAFGNSESLSVGDWVLALGNPGGMTFASSLTRGIVSGLNRSVGYSDAANMTYIQTDTAISPGASGGALLNLYGQVVGVNTSKLVAEGFEGMGFSIPISRAKSIVDDLIRTGHVTGRARLGISANQVSDLQRQVQGWPAGVVIVTVDSNSAFQGTDVKVGDIITKADGTAISTMTELYQKLALHKAGDTMKMTIYRPGATGQQGKTFDVTITLLADNGETQNPVK